LTYNKELGKDFLLDLVVGNGSFDEKGTLKHQVVEFVTGGWANVANAYYNTASKFGKGRQRIVVSMANRILGLAGYIFLMLPDGTFMYQHGR